MSVYSSVGASDNMAAPGASVGPVQHLHGDGEVDDHDGGASAGVYGADEGTGLTSEGAGSGLGDRHHDGDDAAGLLDERIGSRWGPHKHAAPLPAAPEPVGTVDVRRSRFPYSIVWTPIPMITWFLPVVGHLGICDSMGRVYDFAGPYTIGEDGMAFGEPARYVTLDPSKARKLSWNAAIDVGNGIYCKRMHNLCCDNCHSHVARCLDEMEYSGISHWNMVMVGAYVILFGKWVSPTRALASWGPFLFLLSLVLLFKFM